MQQQQQDPVIEEYLKALTQRLNEVSQEALVLKARLNVMTKDRDLLVTKLQELQNTQGDVNVNSNQTEEVGNSWGGASSS